MRFRNGYRVADTSFLDSGVVYPVSVDLPSTAITIKAGHQLRVIITASNYPMYNRNMNNGGEMYPGGNLDSVHNPEFVINKIHVGTTHPSHLVLPVDNTNTSIAEIDLFKVEIFPNPSNKLINIQSDEVIKLLTVFDLSGKKLLQTSENTNQIDVTNFKSGVYLLVIETKKGTVTKKIIKN
jgi:hypothetical protein